MDILIVYKEDYPWDVRVEKLANSLYHNHNHNHNKVTIIARNTEQRPSKEISNGVSIRRLPKTPWLPASITRLLNLPLWFNPVWLLTIYRATRLTDKPTIIVRDLPLVRTATIIAKFTGAKVIFDMAEVYPEMYKSSQKFGRRSLFDTIVKNPKLAEKYEAAVLSKVDHTLVMIEESRDRLLTMGIPERNISIVSNTPEREKYKKFRHKHQGDTLKIVYVGFLTELRGLDILIKAVAHYLSFGNRKSSIQVDIVGKGSSKDHLIELVNKLKVNESVKIHGWLDQDEVDELMANANVGALTYRVCGHWNHTIPNKIFDYMLAGLPVLATEVIPIQRIVEETGCGVICKDQDYKDIAEKLELLKNPEVRREFGNKGHDAVIKKFNWETDKLRLYEAIALVNNQ